MANIVKLTGGQTANGTGVGNAATDIYDVSGAANRINDFMGANVNVAGTGDTGTGIFLGSGGPVTDVISLHGSGNLIGYYGDSYGPTNSTIVYTVAANSAGSNEFLIDNVGGVNIVTLGGIGNVIASFDSRGGYLNGAKSNVISTGGYADITLTSDSNNVIDTTHSKATGGSYIQIGLDGDGNYNTPGSATIQISGDYNTIETGDETLTITGGGSNNKVNAEDGANTISMMGQGNVIVVGGGNNVIAAGSGNDTIDIEGYEFAGVPPNAQAFVEDPRLPAQPVDSVTLAGSNNVVSSLVGANPATGYETVDILGAAATGNATITLGNSANAVALGGYGNKVGLGNGGNTVALTGGGNTVTVTDTTGVGVDAITLGAGISDTVTLGAAGGSVSGTGTGRTTVTQSASTATVTVNLGVGAGLVTLADGNDTVTASGIGTRITLGNGDDSVTTTGVIGVPGYVHLGTGNNTVMAGFNTGVVIGGYSGFHYVSGNNTVTGGTDDGVSTAGTGNDTVTLGDRASVNLNASGSGTGKDVVAVGDASTVNVGNGKDSVTAGATAFVNAGSGNDAITTGAGATIVVNGAPTGTDNITVGDGSTVSVTSAVAHIKAVASDAFHLNGLAAGSTVVLAGSNNMAFVGSNASASIKLGAGQTGEGLTVQALDATGAYTGQVEISNFGPGAVLDLQGLTGANGAVLSSYASVLANLVTAPAGSTLDLAGGGKIIFDGVTGLQSSEFAFTTQYGKV